MSQLLSGNNEYWTVDSEKWKMSNLFIVCVYLLLFSQIIDMFSMKLGDASDTEQQAGDSNINPDSSVPIATELSEVLELSKMCLRAIQNLQDEQDRIFDEMEGTECLNGMNYWLENLEWLAFGNVLYE